MYKAIETTKGIYVACNQCNKFYPESKIAELKWEKDNKSLWLCLDHAQEYFNLTTDQTDIKKENIAAAGLLKEGFKEKDVKHYLKKWTADKIAQLK